MSHAMNEQVTPRTAAATAAAVDTPTPREASAPTPIMQDPEQQRPVDDDLPKEIRVSLRTPFSTHFGPNTDSLTFREPMALDIDAVGIPVSNDFSRGWPPLPIVDAKKMTFMMARLANISPNDIIKKMTARDWSTCSLAVQTFFLPDAGRF
jgi:Phage tail assembly chaperone proteins, E, or 41 or 14